MQIDGALGDDGVDQIVPAPFAYDVVPITGTVDSGTPLSLRTQMGTFSLPSAIGDDRGKLMEQCCLAASFRLFPSLAHVSHFPWSPSFGTKRPWVRIPPPRLRVRDDRTAPDLDRKSGAAVFLWLIAALSGPIRQRRGSIPINQRHPPSPVSIMAWCDVGIGGGLGAVVDAEFGQVALTWLPTVLGLMHRVAAMLASLWPAESSSSTSRSRRVSRCGSARVSARVSAWRSVNAYRSAACRWAPSAAAAGGSRAVAGRRVVITGLLGMKRQRRQRFRGDRWLGQRGQRACV